MVHITEMRIVLPMTVEEFRRGQKYANWKTNEDNTEEGQGGTLLSSAPYYDDVYGEGIFTHTIYRLGNRLPDWVTRLVPADALIVDEKSWIVYPFMRSILTIPFFSKLKIEVLSLHLDDAGTSKNALSLTDEELSLRRIDMMDIAANKVAKRDYKPSLDPALYHSTLTGRGPLKPGWVAAAAAAADAAQPLMCAYKVVRAEANYWGVQSKAEKLMISSIRQIFLLTHRNAFCFTDEWYKLQYDEIVAMERIGRQRLKQRVKQPPIVAPKMADASAAAVDLALYNGQEDAPASAAEAAARGNGSLPPRTENGDRGDGEEGGGGGALESMGSGGTEESAEEDEELGVDIADQDEFYEAEMEWAVQEELTAESHLSELASRGSSRRLPTLAPDMCPVCVAMGGTEELAKPVTVYCDTCGEYFCKFCFPTLHVTPVLRTHKRRFLTALSRPASLKLLVEESSCLQRMTPSSTPTPSRPLSQYGSDTPTGKSKDPSPTGTVRDVRVSFKDSPPLRPSPPSGAAATTPQQRRRKLVPTITLDPLALYSDDFTDLENAASAALNGTSTSPAHRHSKSWGSPASSHRYGSALTSPSSHVPDTRTQLVAAEAAAAAAAAASARVERTLRTQADDLLAQEEDFQSGRPFRTSFSLKSLPGSRSAGAGGGDGDDGDDDDDRAAYREVSSSKSVPYDATDARGMPSGRGKLGRRSAGDGDWGGLQDPSLFRESLSSNSNAAEPADESSPQEEGGGRRKGILRLLPKSKSQQSNVSGMSGASAGGDGPAAPLKSAAGSAGGSGVATFRNASRDPEFHKVVREAIEEVRKNLRDSDVRSSRRNNADDPALLRQESTASDVGSVLSDQGGGASAIPTALGEAAIRKASLEKAEKWDKLPNPPLNMRFKGPLVATAASSKPSSANSLALSVEILTTIMGIYRKMNHTLSATTPPTTPTQSPPLPPVGADPYGAHAGSLGSDAGPYQSLVEVTFNWPEKDTPEVFLPQLKMYSVLVEQLVEVKPRALTHQERLAFWLNIYNALVMHAYMVYGYPKTHYKRVMLMHKASYVVGGMVFSALSIEHAVLRAHSYRLTVAGLLPVNKFKSSDERSQCCLHRMEPLISFALCPGTASAPALCVFTAENVQAELQACTRHFLQASVSLNRRTNKVLLPKILHWYEKDFGTDSATLLEWVANQLPDDQKEAILSRFPKNRKGVSKQIQVAPYCWDFRYIFPEEKR